MSLREHHKKMLVVDSGITPEVIEARGYRTVETKSELEGLGFSKLQRRVRVSCRARSNNPEICIAQQRTKIPYTNDMRR